MLVILRLSKITKFYEHKGSFLLPKGKQIKAVEDVSLVLRKGTTLGLVGESGCGKSTLAKIILKLINPCSGQLFFKDEELTKMSEREFRPLRAKMQIVFQDPYSSLSPRLKIKDIVAEPLRAFAGEKQKIKDRVKEVLLQVGLPEDYLHRLPHQLSGGERQRIGIARALATHPELLVLDEAVSSLDISTQAQVLNLLVMLQEKFKLSYLFIAHNLAVVRHLCDQIAVMYRGTIVEKGPSLSVYERPLHPYTKLLLRSMPSLNRKLLKHKAQDNISKGIDRDVVLFSGCSFFKKCEYAIKSCCQNKPELKQVAPGHWVRCFNLQICSNS